MSQRSATNPRNTNRDVKGVARKSASSAKPATANSGTVRVVATSGKEKRKQMEQGENLEGLTKEEKKARKKERRREEDRVYAVTDVLCKADEDYVKYQHMWWAFLGVALVMLVVLYVWLGMTGASEVSGVPQTTLLVLFYVAIIGAIVFDFVKVHPIRNRYQSIAASMSDSKMDAILEKAAEDEDREEAVKEAQKAAKKAERKKNKK